MKVRLIQNLKPVTLEVDELVVMDEFGDPIMVAVRLDERSHLLTKRDDPDFNQVLEMLGMPRVRTDIIRGPNNPRLLLPP